MAIVYRSIREESQEQRKGEELKNLCRQTACGKGSVKKI
jgi:hypothetical protein